MISRKIDAVGLCVLSIASLAEYRYGYRYLCHALQIHPNSSCGSHRSRLPLFPTFHSVGSFHQSQHQLSSLSDNSISNEIDGERPVDDDESLLDSIDVSTLQNLCTQYSLSTSGTKQEMLVRLREFANQQAEIDAQRRRGRTQRVEANLEGKARHTVLDSMQDDNKLVQELEDGYDEMLGYFYYASADTEEERIRKEEERRRQKLAAMRKSQSHITAATLPDDIKPNEKGERVVTVYSTTDRNDLTGMTSQSPMADNMSMDSARFQQKSLRADQPEESLIGGPFGDTSGSKRKKADASQIENAKEYLRELVRNLLATTGAPAFQDDYDEEVEGGSSGTNSFSSPYGFTGFQPERIPPDVLSKSSAALRVNNGKALKEVLSEYELQAIGHDGMAADDKSKGGGHYREVESVGAFLEGYRKAEVRRIARETSTMLLDRLVKEGVKGLDQLFAGMVREGDDFSDFKSTSEGGELNGALVRYLEEAIRVQEQRVKKSPIVNDSRGNNRSGPDERDETELMWNVTRGEDGTIIETFDPNSPIVKKLLREEIEKTKDSAGVMSDRLLSMTVQEKMLLLLKLLRDRVKVEAVIGNDAHARNLRVLAYCLKAANDEERHQLILEELGNSLDVSVLCRLQLFQPFRMKSILCLLICTHALRVIFLVARCILRARFSLA